MQGGATYLTVIFIVCGWLGAIGASLIVLTFLCFPELRTKSRRLLLHLCVADLGEALFFAGYLPRDVLGEGLVCRLHTMLGLYCSAASCMWNAAIAVHMFLLMRPDPQRSPRLRWYHLACWGLPLAAVVPWGVPAVRLQPAHDEYVGWFTCLSDPAVALATYDLPMVACWLATTGFYLATLRRLRKFDAISGVSENELYELQTKFILVPVIFFVCKAPVFATFCYVNVAPSHEVPTWMAVLHAALDPLQPVLNAALFLGCSERVRQRLRHPLQGGKAPPAGIEALGSVYHPDSPRGDLPTASYIAFHKTHQGMVTGADPEVCDLSTINY